MFGLRRCSDFRTAHASVGGFSGDRAGRAGAPTAAINWRGALPAASRDGRNEGCGTARRGISAPDRPRRYDSGCALALGGSHAVMILPQVHLRKPCYDFYFL